MLPSIQFSCSVMSYSERLHESQHARPPCPSPTPGVHPNSCPSSQWCHPTISSSVIPFSSCPKSFPASGSFPISQLFTKGGQSIGVSASVGSYNSRCCSLEVEFLPFLMGWGSIFTLQGFPLIRSLSRMCTHTCTHVRTHTHTHIIRVIFFTKNQLSVHVNHNYKLLS